MIASRDDLKILNSVVGSVSVSMVNLFPCPKSSAKVTFHNNTVFKKVDSIPAH